MDIAFILNILYAIMLFWIIPGFFGGLIAAWVDKKYNLFPKVDWIPAFWFSGLGLFIFCWSIYFTIVSYKNREETKAKRAYRHG